MTEATTTNPLNIRAGDVIEYTGELWGYSKGTKQTVVRVSGQGIHYKHNNWIEFAPGEGWDYTVHYVAQDWDRYYCKSNDTTYTYKNGDPYFTSNFDGGDMKANLPEWFRTSKNLVRLAPEPVKPVEVDLTRLAEFFTGKKWEPIQDDMPGGEESTKTQQWVSVDGSKVDDGERVRIPGSRAIEYKVEGESISIASNVSVHVDHFEELEVLREVIELPTEYGHYESIHEGITYDLNEDGWSEMSGGECQVVLREQVEESAPLTRILTAKEADEKKQHAIAQQKEQYKSKHAQARSRFDAYQEELLDIIRRRNQEKIGLVEEIDRLRAENRSLRGEPDTTW